jgi:hypothetical protein
MNSLRQRSLNWLALPAILSAATVAFTGHQHELTNTRGKGPDFTIRSVKDGAWSNPGTWQPQRVPQKGDRVLVARGTRVVYDVDSPEVIRLVQVAGTLSFARDRNTTLNVGLFSAQNSEVCSETGFACSLEPPGHAHQVLPRRPSPRRSRRRCGCII